MPNLLAIPFKQSYKAPVKQAARDYIFANTDAHPDAFKWDIDRWETVRDEGRGGVAHVDRIHAAIIYNAQLVFILTKLPMDIKLEIAYAPVFSPTALPITLRSLAFERAAILFNLGALYSQLASSEDRSTQDGLTRASTHYQNSAGTFGYLLSSALPKLELPPGDEYIPLDLTDAFVKSLEYLMLAQAQETAWQKAVMNNYKNGLIARLAIKVSTLYQASETAIREASPSIEHLFPSDWLAHIDTKQHHFAAVAQFRKSIDEIEANRYGLEISRLLEAQVEAKKGYGIARRGGVVPAVLNDIKSLLDTVQNKIVTAERDNDLIYHQDVPAASALAAIVEAQAVQSLVPQGLKEPQSVVDKDNVIFGEMPGWGAGEAINIYIDHKQELIRERIVDAAQGYDDEANDMLRVLNLPASLDALEQPIRLPPSLLKRAAEVRREAGPDRIEQSIEDVERLAEHNSRLLDEAMDILDSEASEDEAARIKKPLKRLPSYVANVELTSKGERYRRILTEAQESDEHVRRKWDEAETNIRSLTWAEEDLEVLVPSSTIPTPGQSNTGADVTRTHARALRVLVESLDDIMLTRAQFVRRAQRLSEADDIGPRILKAASGFEQWVDVTPAMFADVSEEELGKYDKFIRGIEEGYEKQVVVLEEIKARNQLFLESRRDDPSIKEREEALQTLDLSYHKYLEITRNLVEGLKFYNDLSAILTQFKESCKNWSIARKHELHSSSLSHSLESLSIQDGEQNGEEQTAPSLSRINSQSKPMVTPVRYEQKPTVTLPSLNSAEWETEDLPPPPGPRKMKNK